MSEWKKKKLGDLISIKGGFSYKGEYIGKGTSLLLGMGCVSFNEIFLLSGARLYSGEAPETFNAKPNDIVLATRQQSDNLPILGAPAILPDILKDKKVIVGTNLYKVENDSEVKNDFLFWLLRNVDYRNHIDSCAKGSTVKMITKDAVESYEFLCPPEKERNAIASNLWNISRKIDLLQNQNVTLEKMAETLFREWFVEKVKEDWEMGPLGDFVNIAYGKNLPTKNLLPTGYPVFGGNGQIGFFDRYIYEKPQVLVSCRGEASGVVNISLEKSYVTNNSLILEIGKRPEITFEYLKYSSLNTDFKTFVSGSAQPQITIEGLYPAEFVLAPNELISSFTEIVRVWEQKRTNNQTQIRILTALRDTLLPKLMSREVTVDI